MLLLNINWKPYMASEMVPLDLTLSDLEGQSQHHSDIRWQKSRML